MYEVGVWGAAAPQNGKVGQIFSNYTEIQAIFAEISEKTENFELVSRVIFAEFICLPLQNHAYENLPLYNKTQSFLNPFQSIYCNILNANSKSTLYTLLCQTKRVLIVLVEYR